MSKGFKPPIVPAAFFGIVLGLAGLGNAWRAAHQVWQLPAIVGEIILALASIVWAVLIALFACAGRLRAPSRSVKLIIPYNAASSASPASPPC